MTVVKKAKKHAKRENRQRSERTGVIAQRTEEFLILGCSRLEDGGGSLTGVGGTGGFIENSVSIAI